jgi:predicted metal-dependent hydrolase
MFNKQNLKVREIHRIEDIEFSVKYSRRRTIGISVLPDSSVIVRVPYLTSFRTISRIVNEKYIWILKHRDNYRNLENRSFSRLYTSGETHLFRGNESVLRIEKSIKPYIRFLNNIIELGIDKPDDTKSVRKLLYKGYKNEALIHLPEIMKSVLKEQEHQMFKPTGLIIRTMKRRWGSCSNKGIITLSTELIKLPDLYIEYVIIHELCHLKHHNHGPHYYKLLTEVYPEWRSVRKELRQFVQ